MHAKPREYVGKSSKKIYEGKFTLRGDPVVTVNGVPLSHEREMNWGYGGGGPRELAIALLSDLIGPDFAKKYSWMLHKLVTEKLKQKEPWILIDKSFYFEFMTVRTEDIKPATREAFDAIRPFFITEP